MALTLHGGSLPISLPVVDNPVFMEAFAKMFETTTTAIGSSATIAAGQAFGVYQLNSLTGSTATLPAATGTGMQLFFYVSALATTNSHKVICSPLTDGMVGVVQGFRTDSGNAVLGFAGITGGSQSNTITLNRTTTGSVSVGEWLWLADVASAVWLVRGMLSATGAAFATPFSHT